MTDLTGWLTIINLVILIAAPIGGVFVFRSAIARTESDVQERVREALSAENELLTSRVARLERENNRLNKLIRLIVSILKKAHSIDLEITDDVVTLRDVTGTHTAQISSPDTVP